MASKYCPATETEDCYFFTFDSPHTDFYSIEELTKMNIKHMKGQLLTTVKPNHTICGFENYGDKCDVQRYSKVVKG